MTSIELSQDEIQSLINLLAGSSVPILQAEAALETYNKLKEAKE